MLNLRFRRGAPDAARPLLVPVAEGVVPPRFAAAATAARFAGKAGSTLDLAGTPRCRLLGLGTPRRQLDWEVAGAGAALADAPHWAVEARGIDATEAAWLAGGLALGAWRFDRHRSGTKPPRLERITLHVQDPQAAERAWAQISPGIEGCLYARDLVSEPANHLTTRGFVHELEKLAAYGIHVDVWGRRRLTRAG